MRKLIALAATVAMAASAKAGDAAYTMDDVNALAKSGGWQELLAKAKKVPPSARTADWSKLVTDAAVHVIEEPGQGGLQALSASNQALHEYPHLKTSAPYMKARGAEGVKALQRCFQYVEIASECNREMKTFVSSDPSNDGLAFEAGKLAARSFTSKNVAMTYFNQAFKGKAADPRCNDEQAVEVMAYSLALGAADSDAQLAKATATGPCAKMKPESARKLVASADAMKMVCPEFAGALTGIVAKKCRETTK